MMGTDVNGMAPGAMNVPRHAMAFLIGAAAFNDTAAVEAAYMAIREETLLYNLQVCVRETRVLGHSLHMCSIPVSRDLSDYTGPRPRLCSGARRPVVPLRQPAPRNYLRPCLSGQEDALLQSLRGFLNGTTGDCRRS
jgi:hypothetical protein